MSQDGSRLGTIAVPIAILVAVAGLIMILDPGSMLVRQDAPPAEALTFQTTKLEPGRILLTITNEGPDPVTIAQVLVDEAYWQHTVRPDRVIDPLETSTVDIPYPWVEGEAHEVVLVSSTGATFGHEIEVALETPGVTAKTLGVYTLIGILVGVVPIFAGLLWYPAIRKAGAKVEMGILAFTVGLLAFLALDSLEHALELADLAPGPIGGPGLVFLATVAAMGALIWTGHKARTMGTGDTAQAKLVTAYMIAVGIGLHNLGEGLAIGAAYAIGEVALGSFLILGFTLHNVTEGPAIVAPLARRKTALKHLAMLGIIAGVPTVFGAWMGGYAFSPTLGAVFFGLGTGAMLQVIVQVVQSMRGEVARVDAQGVLAAGFILGAGVMWATGLLI